MPTNSNYLSVLTGFGSGKYFGNPGVCPGSNSFSASVLFFQVLNNSGNQLRYLWASAEAAIGAGWAISLDTDNVSLLAQVADTAGTKNATYDLTGAGAKTTRLGRMILATLVVAGGNMKLFVNGDLVATTALNVGGVVPSTSNPVVGSGLGSVAAIAGVGYREGAPTNDAVNALFLGCQDSVDLSSAWIVPDAQSFTNLWSAKDAGAGSTPSAKAIWTPRVGTENLALAGTLGAIGFKNLAWYS